MPRRRHAAYGYFCRRHTPLLLFLPRLRVLPPACHAARHRCHMPPGRRQRRDIITESAAAFVAACRRYFDDTPMTKRFFGCFEEPTPPFFLIVAAVSPPLRCRLFRSYACRRCRAFIYVAY